MKTTKEAADLYEHRNDDGEWSDEVEEIEVRPRRTEVVSFRLPSEELDRLESVAEAAGESLSQFVRNAIQMRLDGRIGDAQRIPVVGFMNGRGIFTVEVHGYLSSSMGEAPTSWVPDRPPVLVNVTPKDG
jgi:Ribbon-helix-helix protein, copG family